MKACLLCGNASHSALATCPHCGEATWGASTPGEKPKRVAPVLPPPPKRDAPFSGNVSIDEEPAPAPDPTPMSKRSRK